MRTQAQKEASKRYREKIIQKQIEYKPTEIEEYRRIEEHLLLINISYQKYVKQLIRKDMETW